MLSKKWQPWRAAAISITVAVVLTASAVQSHYLYVNLLEYFLPGKGVFKAQCCCYYLIDWGIVFITTPEPVALRLLWFSGVTVG